MKSQYLHKLLFISSLILIASLSIIVPSTLLKVTNTPDENYNYLLTKEYARSGNLYIEKDYTQYDTENLLHPRQFVSYHNKQVPFNYFGLPIYYGFFYLFFADFVKLISFAFAIILSIYIMKISHLIFKTESLFTVIAIISCTPLIYYLNHPYFNVTIAITFFTIATYYLLKYVNDTNIKYLIISSIFFSSSIFIRNHYILWAGLFLITTLWLKHKSFNNITMLRDILIFGSILFTIFFIPLLLINYSLYDNPLTYSFSLFHLVYPETFIDLNASGGFKVEQVTSFLVPRDFNSATFFKNLYRLTYGIMPIYSIISLVGIISIIKSKKYKISNKYMILYILLIIYILVYKGGSYSWGSSEYSYFGLDISIIRYWLIFYIFTIFIVAKGLYAISKKSNALGAIIVIIILVTSMTNLIITNEKSLQTEKKILFGLENIANIVNDNIDEKSIVFSDYGDKILSPYDIDVASWWSQADTYDPQKITNSMNRIYYNTNYTVYLLKTQQYIKINELNEGLLKSNLILSKSTDISPGIELYVLESLN